MRIIVVILACTVILKFYGEEQNVLPPPIEKSLDIPLNAPAQNESDTNYEELQTTVSSEPATTLPVIFKAFYRTILSAEVTSKVLNITKRMGEKFEQGDLLVQLDDSIYQGLKEKALGNLSKAEAQYYAKDQLFQDHIASFIEVKSAQADVAVAKSDLISAEHAIRACHVVAPYNGKVVTVMVEEHELIQEGKPLMEIVDDEDLIGQVLVPSQYLLRAELNKKIRIEIVEIQKVVEGKIFRVDPVIDPASSTFKIDILVPNKEGVLRSGMIGQTRLEIFKEDDTTKSVIKE